MKRLCILAAVAMIALGAAPQEDPWKALRVFEGKWQGPTSGKPGEGTTTREYRFELNGHFLSQRDKSEYRRKEPGAELFLHEDWGMFSYDTEQKKILWRQYHSEGLVNEYELESVAADGKSLEFDTTRIENRPGLRAKKVYRIVSADEIDETFYVAPPGKDFEVYTGAHLRRVK